MTIFKKIGNVKPQKCVLTLIDLKIPANKNTLVVANIYTERFSDWIFVKVYFFVCIHEETSYFLCSSNVYIAFWPILTFLMPLLRSSLCPISSIRYPLHTWLQLVPLSTLTSYESRILGISPKTLKKVSQNYRLFW